MQRVPLSATVDLQSKANEAWDEAVASLTLDVGLATAMEARRLPQPEDTLVVARRLLFSPAKAIHVGHARDLVINSVREAEAKARLAGRSINARALRQVPKDAGE